MLRGTFGQPRPLRCFRFSQIRNITRNPGDVQHRQSSESLPQPTEDDPLPSVKPNNDGLALYFRQWPSHAVATLKNGLNAWATTTGLAFSRLGSEISKVSGYQEIEDLKKKVVEHEVRMNAARLAARQAKAAYDNAAISRSSSQREVNELLHRKSNWTDSDVTHFTNLVRQDHIYEQDEANAKRAVQDSENDVEREFGELMRSILARYHEEQVWSDKIRSVSTYGSLAVMALNLVVFMTAVLAVEPWKRRKLIEAFETKVIEMNSQSTDTLKMGMNDIHGYLEKQNRLLSQVGDRHPVGGDVSLDIEDISRSPPSAISRWELGVVGTTAVIAGITGWLARWLFRE